MSEHLDASAVCADAEIERVMAEDGWPFERLVQLQAEAGPGIRVYLSGDMGREAFAYLERRIRELVEAKEA